MEEHNQNTLERKTVKELNILDPAIYKDVPVLCRAAISRIITANGWYYEACPRCFRKLISTPDNDLLLCPEHDMQHKKLCFIIELMIEDKSDTTTALLMGKTEENTLNVSCAALIEEKGFKDQNNPPEEILKLKGQIKDLQIKLGIHNDLVIKAIYPDSDLPGNNKKQKSAHTEENEAASASMSADQN